MFQKSSVMSPNLALLQNQRDESFCHRAARRGNRAAPNEGKLASLLKWRCNNTACLTDGQAGRVAATLEKMGIGGCGLAAPPIGEDKPAMVARALLIVL